MLIEDYLELKRKTKEEHSKSLDIFKSVSFLEHSKMLSYFSFIIVFMFFSINGLIFNKYSSIAPMYGFTETFSFYESIEIFEFMINNGVAFNNYLDSIGILVLGASLLVSVFNLYLIKNIAIKSDRYTLTNGFVVSLVAFTMLSFGFLTISVICFIYLLLGGDGRTILEILIQQPIFTIISAIFCYSIIFIIFNVILYNVNQKHSYKDVELFYSKIKQLNKQTESCKNRIIKNKQEVKHLAKILKNYQEFEMGETKTLIFECNDSEIPHLENLFKDYESFILALKNKRKELKKYDEVLEKEEPKEYSEIKNI
jgi:hypothetical protein